MSQKPIIQIQGGKNNASPLTQVIKFSIFLAIVSVDDGYMWVYIGDSLFSSIRWRIPHSDNLTLVSFIT